MKAVLNVDGKKLEVASISFYKDEVVSLVAVNGAELVSYYDANCAWIPVGAKVLYLNELLEYPSIEQTVSDKWKKLIEHLEEVAASEHETLVNLAVNVMKIDGLPFIESALVEGHQDYKRMEQRVTGVIDTVEEVKAFMEGWYADDDDATTNETEVANQTT